MFAQKNKIKNSEENGSVHVVFVVAIVVGLVGALLFTGYQTWQHNQSQAGSSVKGRETYRNTIINSNLPDPTIIRDQKSKQYHLFATGVTSKGPFPHYVSDNLVEWELLSKSVFRDTPNCLVGNNIKWAPDVAKIDDKYFMTFTCGSDDTRKIGYAVSDSAGGPYKYMDILVNSAEYVSRGGPGKRGTIDSHIFVDGNKVYLYFGGGFINVVELKKFGNKLTKTNQFQTRIMTGSTVNGTWNTVEGAWVTKKHGWYYLYYSYGDYEKKFGQHEYSVRIARSKSPMGPFSPKSYKSVIKGSGNNFRGPGGNSMTTDDSGQEWIVYHAWSGSKRVILTDKIRYTADQWPYIKGYSPSSQKELAPSIR
jgi:arabinan endo-1,5-alpha-L-arabinosidase